MIDAQNKTTTLYSYQNGIGANTEAILNRTLRHILYGNLYDNGGGTVGSLWNSTSVVMQNISDAANAYHTLEGSATRSTMGASLSGSYKWGGGVLAPNGKIYCVPYNASDILIIDPVANTATRSNMGVSLTGSDKWLGGVLAPNGKIYCVPSHSSDILIIDPETNTATRSTMGASLSDSYNYAGGVLAPNGKIYCVPRNPADILIINKHSSVPALDIKDCLSPHLNKF